MTNFWPNLPTGSAAFIFLLSIAIGFFVLFKFSLDQFEQPSESTSDPWKFVGPRYLTTRRQYVIGFSIYLGILTILFISISLIGPGTVTKIAETFVQATGQTVSNSGATANLTVETFPTFPILVMFYMIGLNPNLPKILNFEPLVRLAAHKTAYIPRNMRNTFNFMRLSDFAVPTTEIAGACNAIGLRPLLVSELPSVRVQRLFEKGVFLYVVAAQLAGDLAGVNIRYDGLNIEIFQRYRTELEQVLVALEAAHAKIAELGNDSAAIQKVERDLIKNLEFLYVIFSCAITTKGKDRAAAQLAALGFRSDMVKPPGVPWNPLLKASFGIAAVLGSAALIGQREFPETVRGSNIPPTIFELLWLIASIMVVHTVAVGLAMHMRTRLIVSEKYFLVATGARNVVALLEIFVAVGLVSLLIYLTGNLQQLFKYIAAANANGIPVVRVCQQYLANNLVWSLLPACCGVLTAITVDLRSGSPLQRVKSGLIEGGVMSAISVIAPWIVPSLIGESSTNGDPLGYYIFNGIIYGGIGAVFGYVLPEGVKRYWDALAKGLPDRISVLRAAIAQYFHDIQQFQQWLNTPNDGLQGKRPLDILSEDTGEQRLVSFVSQTRRQVSPRPV